MTNQQFNDYMDALHEKIVASRMEHEGLTREQVEAEMQADFESCIDPRFKPTPFDWEAINAEYIRNQQQAQQEDFLMEQHKRLKKAGCLKRTPA